MSIGPLYDAGYAKGREDGQNRPHVQRGANIIAKLLAHTLTHAEREGRRMSAWEREGIAWLRDQWTLDRDTSIDMWIADRYVSNTGLDLYAKLNTDSLNQQAPLAVPLNSSSRKET